MVWPIRKVDNCQVGVFAALSKGSDVCLIDIYQRAELKVQSDVIKRVYRQKNGNRTASWIFFNVDKACKK